MSGQRLVSLRVPVVRGGTLRYVLSLALAPDGIGLILRDVGAPPGWTGAILDAEGRLMACTPGDGQGFCAPADGPMREAMARTPSGFYHGRTLDGLEVDTSCLSLFRFDDGDGWGSRDGLGWIA